VTLKEMTDHIYGRGNILTRKDRPHMFIKELQLNVQYMTEQAGELKPADVKQAKDVFDFGKQLLTGIEYYRGISNEIIDAHDFETQLDSCQATILDLMEEIARRFDF
jgi:hypothetical protein